MNFDLSSLFGGALGEVNELEALEAKWKEYIKSGKGDGEFNETVKKTYDLFLPAANSETVEKKIISIFSLVYHFSVIAENEKERGIAEALAGLVSYSVAIISEGKRELQVYLSEDDYIYDIDRAEFIRI